MLVYLYTADGTLEDVVVPQQVSFTFEGKTTGTNRVVVAAAGHERVVREVELAGTDVDLHFDLTRGGTLRVAVSEVADMATARA